MTPAQLGLFAAEDAVPAARYAARVRMNSSVAATWEIGSLHRAYVQAGVDSPFSGDDLARERRARARRHRPAGGR